jgi:hypothetical protein
MSRDVLLPRRPFRNANAGQDRTQQRNKILPVCPNIGIRGERRIGIYMMTRPEEMEDPEADTKDGGPEETTGTERMGEKDAKEGAPNKFKDPEG